MTESYKIGVVGGTGPQGMGLALRLARAGHSLVLGSRDSVRAATAAEQLNETLHGAALTGRSNIDAALLAEIVILAVPYNGHAELVTDLAEALENKIVVSCVNPLGFDKRGPYGLKVPAGSAAEELVQRAAGARVVGAFHHLAAPLLLDLTADLSHEDVLVCGDDVDAKETVMRLAAHVTGGRGVDAGSLRMAAQLEPLTAVLISVNKRYKTRSGLALTGVPSERGVEQ